MREIKKYIPVLIGGLIGFSFIAVAEWDIDLSEVSNANRALAWIFTMMGALMGYFSTKIEF